MHHRIRGHHRKLGWPEIGLVCSLLIAIVPATLWWRLQYQPEWNRTAGHVTSCKLTRVHYNAQDYRTKAVVGYDYSVGMAAFRGEFDGFWPEVGGPNALSPVDVDRLNEPKHEVAVFYDPVNPERSTLHPTQEKPSPLWIVFIAAAFCAAGAYTFFIYPVWRA